MSYPLYDRLAASPERWQAVAFRSQADCDTFNNTQISPNPSVVYDPGLDAARMWTRAGVKGIPSQHELSIPLNFGPPVPGDTWTLGYDLRISPEVLAFFRDHLQGNGGTKFCHPRGAHGTDTDFGDGYFKFQLTVRVGGTPRVTFYSQTRSQTAPLVPVGNSTSNEPWAPSNWSGYHIPLGQWLRVWHTWTVGLTDPAIPDSTYESWLKDEAGTLLVGQGPMDIHYPWNPATGVGVRRLHIIQSWKETFAIDADIAVRNVFALHNVTPQQAADLASSPVESSGGTVATISNADFRKIKKLALDDPAVLSELRSSGVDRPTLKAVMQAIEDWSNKAAVRSSAKTDIDAAAGITTTNTFSTQLFKLWAQYHGGA